MTETSPTILPEQPSLGKKVPIARRRYQLGSIQLRNGNWSGRFLQDESLPDGTVRRVHRRVFLGTKTEIPTQKAARRKLEQFLTPINSGSYKPKHVITLAEFLPRWEGLAYSGYEPGTVASFKTAKGHVLPALGAVQLADLNTETIQRFIASLTDLAPSSIHNTVKLLRASWKSAEAWGYVTHDPFKGLKMPKIERARKHAFTQEEVNRILAAAEEPYRTLYWILAQTGLRIGEVLALTWETVSPENGQIEVKKSVWRGQVKKTKTQAGERTLLISPKLAAHLATFRDGSVQSGDVVPIRATGLLFSHNGKPLSADYILRRKFQPFLKSLGLPEAGFHSFRHANATFMDSMNVPMKTRQTRLGHADAETTMNIYTHTVTNADRELANQFDQVIGL
jgi:integrase